MRLTTCTGNEDRDYVLLEPDNMSEAANLVDLSRNGFIPKGATELVIKHGFREPLYEISLRIFVTPHKVLQALDAATKADLDAES